MAAAIIAIVTSLVPAIIPLVAKLIDRIKGNGSGAEKKALGTDVLVAIMAALQGLLPAGVSLPTDKGELGLLLQAVVDQLNKKGVLKGTETVVDADANSTLMAGVALIAEGALMILKSSSGGAK